MPQPTHDQTLYRGDWILEHYIAILRQEIKWHQHTHTSHNPRTPGAYHPQHDHYDPDLLPQPTPTQPRYFNFTIPPEPRIDQPTEHHTTTPTWARQLTHQLHTYDILHDITIHAINLNQHTPPFAYYDQTTQRMKLGAHPPTIHHATQLASQSLPPNLEYPNETT
jgi:hypothetical protein